VPHGGAVGNGSDGGGPVTVRIRTPFALRDARWLLRWTSVGLLVVFVSGALARRGVAGQVRLLDVGLFNAVHLLALASCLWPRPGPEPMRTAWRWVAVALAVTTVANVTFSLAPDGAGPGVADGLYLAAYPAAFVAVLVCIRSRVQGLLPTLAWDGVVTALGLGAVLAALPQGRRAAAGGVATLCYPAADLLLICLLAWCAVVLQGRWSPALSRAAAGLTAVSLADVFYLVQRADGTYAEGGLFDTVQLAGVALVGLAAASADRVPAVRTGDARRFSWRLLLWPSVATVGSVALLARPSGAPASRWLAAACVLGALVRMLLTLREIRQLAGVHREARTDDLTGLENRRSFVEQCDALLRGATPAAPVAVMLLDLDGFKDVNDSLGHAAGDDLLLRVAERLVAALPPHAVAARLAGDEFAVLLPSPLAHDVRAVADGVHAALRRPFALDRISVAVTTSIGVATAPDAAETRRDLLRCADVALSRAKAERSGPVRYDRDADPWAAEDLGTAVELRRTLQAEHGAGRLLVHLQPQVRLDTLAVTGVEALLRWEHPTRGLLAPDRFLAAAQTAGLMDALTTRVLDAGLRACRHWWSLGYRIPVAVNVSAAGLHDEALPGKVMAALRRHGLPADALTVELTEDALVTRPDRARRVLDQLRAAGVGVSMDDYGTGYSSLAHLRRLPVDEIKLDRMLLEDLANDATAAAIVRYTVDLAHTLNVRLVAEGIEDDDTLALVTEIGADVGQGFHVCGPLPEAQLLTWLAEHHPRATAGPPPPRAPRQATA
jgi:diguanylate cyclase